MKKLLGSTLALALLVPSMANAELLKNFKASGSLEVDAVSANNVSDFNTASYDHVDTVQTRVMVHTDWDLLDDVHSRVSLTKNDRTWGTGNQSVSGAAGTSVLENTFVDEAYVKIDKLFGALDTTAGRQFYGEAGDLVIYFGPKMHQYGLPVTALDALRLDWSGEKVGLTAIAGKVTGKAIGGIDTGDVNLHGVDVHVKPMDNVSAGAYVYGQTTILSGGGVAPGKVADDHLYVAGLKAKVTMGAAWLKAEFAKNFGQNRAGVNADGSYTFTGNYTGWAGLANAGVKADVNNLGALTAWGEYGLGSGGATPNRAFTAIAGDYRPGSIFGRFIANGGGSLSPITFGGTLSNLQTMGVGVKATPAALNKLTVGLSGWNYRFQNAAGADVVAQGINGPTATAGSKNIGTEYDLDLTWAHSENVSVSAGAGQLVPGGFIKNAQQTGGLPNNPIHLCHTDLSVKF